MALKLEGTCATKVPETCFQPSPTSTPGRCARPGVDGTGAAVHDITVELVGFGQRVGHFIQEGDLVGFGFFNRAFGEDVVGGAVHVVPVALDLQAFAPAVFLVDDAGGFVVVFVGAPPLGGGELLVDPLLRRPSG